MSNSDKSFEKVVQKYNFVAQQVDIAYKSLSRAILDMKALQVEIDFLKKSCCVEEEVESVE